MFKIMLKKKKKQQSILYPLSLHETETLSTHSLRCAVISLMQAFLVLLTRPMLYEQKQYTLIRFTVIFST